MHSRPDELEAFKSEIDLVAFAETHGFVIDRKKTSKGSVAMKHPNGENIRIAKKANGHYIYTSVHDDRDRGTIVDFLQRRGGGTLGQVRKALRPWIGGGDFSLGDGLRRANPPSRRVLETIRTDFEAVRVAWEAMSPVEPDHPYLTSARSIPRHVLEHAKFAGRIRSDARGNVCFPHWDRGGHPLTGYEIKNAGFTGFAKGGAKRLFGSGIDEGDHELVICETAIDLLSYAALFGIAGRRFVSTAGALNPEQPALLRFAMEKMPAGSRIVFAVDADKGGNALCAQLVAIFGEANGLGLTQDRHSPATSGQDWNDVLREQTSPPPLEP